MTKVILGSQKVVLIRMDFLGWPRVRSFNCDMYWPFLNTYRESSGFGLGGFCITGGGVTNREGINYGIMQ